MLKNFYTTEEIAGMLKIKKFNLYNILKRNHIPEPVEKLGDSRLWTWSDFKNLETYFLTRKETRGRKKKIVKGEQWRI